MRIFWGLVFMGVGVLIVMKTEWLINNFGRLDFFERKLSTLGGSRIGYKLTGIGFIVVGTMMITNLTEGFVEWLAGLFIPG